MSEFVFVAPFARRLPDPVFGEITRHIMFVPVSSIPEGLPMGINPRGQNTDKLVYKQVRDSLTADDGSFHLKHKGMTIVASSVERLSDTGDEYRVIFDGTAQGMLDGGHTYTLILENRDSMTEEQYVKIEILTGLDPDWIPDIAGGLNTSVQVQAMSLDHLKGRFDWIKDELKDMPYFGQIAWRENDKGDYDAREVVALLYCFNIFAFPNQDTGRFPYQAYSNKQAVLRSFEAEPEQFKKLRPILRDILTLVDTISYEAKGLYNETGGRGGRVHFVDHRDTDRKPFAFTFINKKAHDRIQSGALYPMLAAFRWLAVEDPDTGLVRWRDGFESVLALWQATAPDLFTSTKEMGRALGYNVNALGKNVTHWQNLYRSVAMADLMKNGKQ